MSPSPMLTHGAEAKGWGYQQTNPAKRQKHQRGLARPQGWVLGRGELEFSAAEAVKSEGPTSQRKAMQSHEIYWLPPKISTEFSSCPDQEVKNPCRKPKSCRENFLAVSWCEPD